MLFLGASLASDFFLDDTNLPDISLTDFNAAKPAAAKPAAKPADSAAFSDPELNKTFNAIKSLVSADLIKSVGGFFLFDLKGILW